MVPEKTSICILPVDPQKPDRALVRTSKAMRASINGIPLVSSVWISDCIAAEKVVPPTTWVWSLPSKNATISDEAGVSILAAALHATHGEFRLLRNYKIFLCGSFPIQKRLDVTALLREAGATLVKRLPARCDESEVIVVLCEGNSTKSLPKTFERNYSRYDKHRLLVVNTDWLFDSVSCGIPLKANEYEPEHPKARSIWKVLCTSG